MLPLLGSGKGGRLEHADISGLWFPGPCLPIRSLSSEDIPGYGHVDIWSSFKRAAAITWKCQVRASRGHGRTNSRAAPATCLTRGEGWPGLAAAGSFSDCLCLTLLPVCNRPLWQEEKASQLPHQGQSTPSAGSQSFYCTRGTFGPVANNKISKSAHNPAPWSLFRPREEQPRLCASPTSHRPPLCSPLLSASKALDSLCGFTLIYSSAGAAGPGRPAKQPPRC